MATANSLLILGALASTPPATNFGTFNSVAGADGTDVEAIPTIAFDDTTDEFADFYVELPRLYGGNGLTFTIKWLSAAATSGVCIWQLAVRRVEDDGEDLTSTDHAYAFNTVAATTASAAGELDCSDITFTDGSDMDSWAVGEVAILRFGRDANNGSDTLSGDALLLSMAMKET